MPFLSREETLERMKEPARGYSDFYPWAVSEFFTKKVTLSQGLYSAYAVGDIKALIARMDRTSNLGKPNRDRTPLTEEDREQYVISNPGIIDSPYMEDFVRTETNSDLIELNKDFNFYHEQKDILERFEYSDPSIAWIATKAFDPFYFIPAIIISCVGYHIIKKYIVVLKEKIAIDKQEKFKRKLNNHRSGGNFDI